MRGLRWHCRAAQGPSRAASPAARFPAAPEALPGASARTCNAAFSPCNNVKTRVTRRNRAAAMCSCCYLQMHFSSRSPPRYTKIHTPVRAEHTLRVNSLLDAATRLPVPGACPPGSETGGAEPVPEHVVRGTPVAWVHAVAHWKVCKGGRSSSAQQDVHAMSVFCLQGWSTAMCCMFAALALAQRHLAA